MARRIDSDDVQGALGDHMAGLKVGSSREERKGKGRAATGDPNENSNHWIWRPGSEHPYELEALSTVDADLIQPLMIFHYATYFPWPVEPPEFVGDQDERSALWHKLSRKWCNVVAICGANQVRLVRTTKALPFEVILDIPLAGPHYASPPSTATDTNGNPTKKNKTKVHHVKFDMEDRVITVTWAIDPLTLTPLLCFGGFAGIIFVYDLNSNMIRSRIRGHGGAIMHMTTHPTFPHIIASSSRDHSTRITDLTIPQDYPITYPLHPDGSRNTGNFPMGGEPQIFPPPIYAAVRTAEGTQSSTQRLPEGPEGSGPGRCIAVLGWWMEGHREVVSCADFHPTLPMIATGGLDHAVIIWALPRLSVGHQFGASYSFAQITDPLFKTTLIHDAPLDSIYWLTKDILVSKTWIPENLATEARCIIWRWTQLTRFYPEDVKPRFWGPLSGVTFLRHTHDVDNSRLYRVLGDIPEVNNHRYTRIGLHRPIYPRVPDLNTIVQDLMIAIPSDSGTGVIDLCNPCLPGALIDEPILEDPDNEMEVDRSSVGRWVLSEPHIRACLPRWEDNRGDLHLLSRVPLRCVAISPRGARWIVGVGECGIITVWSMRDV